LAGLPAAFTNTPSLGSNGGTTGSVRLVGNSGGGIVTLTVLDGTGTWTMKLPNSVGTAGQALLTDGINTASWGSVSGGAGSGVVASGTAGQIAYYATTTPQVDGNVNANISAGALTLGVAAGTVGQLKLANTTAGVTTLTPGATSAGTLTLPAGTDTLVGKATTDIFTNKTFDTAGSGNSLQIASVVVSANTGTGEMVRKVSPTLTTPTIGVATATSINGLTITASTGTLTLTNSKTLSVSNTMTLTANDGSSVAFGAGGTVAYTIASGTKALATGAIASATCTTAQTSTATGTATTDILQASFNGDPTAVTGYVPLTAGMLTIIAYPTLNTANFKVCNNTTSSITPGAITLNWRVTR
jgi:hypothetical protein